MATVKVPVLLMPGEDGYIVALIPVIQGCISQDTPETTFRQAL